jgi:hypothetical protein
MQLPAVLTVNCAAVPPWNGDTSRMRALGEWVAGRVAVLQQEAPYVVVVLQEVFFPQDLDDVKRGLGGCLAYVSGILNYRRASAVALRPSLLPPFVSPGEGCISGGVVVASTAHPEWERSLVFRDCCQLDCLALKGAALVRFGDGGFDVLATHLQAFEFPAGARARQLEQIRRFVASHGGGRPTVYVGDWNEADRETLEAALGDVRDVRCTTGRCDTHRGEQVDRVLVSAAAGAVPRRAGPSGSRVLRQLTDHVAFEVVFM